MPETQIPLIPDEPYEPPEDFALLCTLLEQAATLTAVSDFLRLKGEPHSAGSWDDLREKRLIPALRKGKITIDELRLLLAEVEEFGHMHTILFHCPGTLAKKFLTEKAIADKAREGGLSKSLGSGTTLDQPKKPTITSIRRETHAKWGGTLVIKVVEKRVRHDFIRDREIGKKYVREWAIVEERAVNVVRLFDTGLLEVRIASHKNSTKYAADLSRILKIVKDFIPPQGVFSDLSLGKAKIKLWTQREENQSLVRFSTSTFKTSTGGTLSAASGEGDGDLFSSKNMKAGLGAFWDAGNADCESSNIYWLPGQHGLPSEEIHMLLPEFRNEFAIPASCSKQDYEYVLDQLTTLSN